MILSRAIEGFIFEFSSSHSSSTAYRVCWLGDAQIENINPAASLPAFVKMNHRRASTVDNHWKALRSFFNWSVENRPPPRQPCG